jgi:protein TonB
MRAIISLLSLTLLSVTTDAQSLESKPFVCIIPEIPPSFPGGLDSLRSFVSKNLVSPKNEDYEGMVVIEFVVNIDGSLNNIKVAKGLCGPCDKSALEVFSKMPKWIPGREVGKPKAMRMYYPIKFTL